MSPEGLAHAMDQYIASLKHQREVAEAFYFGHLEQAMRGLYELPEDVRMRIDELIWSASGKEALDIMDPESHTLIAAAIMRSVEERMGML